MNTPQPESNFGRQISPGPLPITICILAAVALCLRTPDCAGADSTNALQSASELKTLTLEELGNIEVTSVSKQPEKLFETASAIQVITGEDIRRSGASSLPEALRLAPNLQVAQMDSRQWAISARGFNNGLANKLLVLMDGRTLYTPLYAGVFWDAQDTMLADIDRIEVISGPGGTLWGANAVNGVINIITRSAKDTQGTLLEAGGGSLLEAFGGARYGGQLSSNVFFRIYGKYFDRDNTVQPDGTDGTNGWHMGQGGFRVDWLPEGGDTITLQGDGYSGRFDQAFNPDGVIEGENILGRWIHPIAEGSDLTTQLYWDRTYRESPPSFIETLNTYDLDVQHRFPLGHRQSVMWGGGYRLLDDHVETGTNLMIIPPDRHLQLFSVFAQDIITIVPDRLDITLGTKVEHNDYTEFEVQPSGRIAWTPDNRQTIWGAVSRAVRSPSRIDRDLFLQSPIPIAGGEGFNSETVLAYELGYRIRPANWLTVSWAGFYNDYNDIRSLSTNAFSNNAFVFDNNNRADEWGSELSATIQPVRWWRARGGYTYLNKRVHVAPGGSDLNNGRAEGNDPQNQVILQSMLDLPYRIEFDATFRYVDSLPDPPVPSYVSLDLRLAWRAVPNLEMSLVGQNLLDNRHPEFGQPDTRQEIPRSIYGKITWRF